MIPEIWSATDRTFLSFWTNFCPFSPLTAWKMTILKKWKKHLKILSFYRSVPKIMIICYTVPEVWNVTDVIVIFHFRLFLPFYPLTAQKIKISKKFKKSLEISSFYIRVAKIIIRWCTVLEVWCATNGWTDGQTYKMWHIEVGAQPPNCFHASDQMILFPMMQPGYAINFNVYISAHIVKIFRFSFPQLYFFCILPMKEGCDFSLVERHYKIEEKLSIYVFSFSATQDLDDWLTHLTKQNVALLQEKKSVFHSFVFSFNKNKKLNPLEK